MTLAAYKRSEGPEAVLAAIEVLGSVWVPLREPGTYPNGELRAPRANPV
jgi:hypothetical protein